MDKDLSSGLRKISIVIPVYNVEQYLVRCLNSIFNQQFSGLLEVIAVDDASTDNSLQVLQDYQRNEPRLKVIRHESNKKLSMARSTGMKAISGDYVMHVDSDDWLLNNSLENLYRKCLETDADVVVYNHIKEDSIGKKVFVNGIKKELITTDKQEVHQHFLGAPWNKIVKSHLVRNMISGQVGVNNGEDLIYTTEILLRAKKICLLPENYYVYFVNTQSLTWVVSTEQFLKNLIVVLKQLQILILEYHPSPGFQFFLMNYFEKWIYLESAKIHFSSDANMAKINRSLIGEFFLIPVMDEKRSAKLKISLNNKVINLFEVSKRFGTKVALSILAGGVKRYLFK
jgi:glycosyltransferase involved in cell wall biosynthesis